MDGSYAYSVVWPVCDVVDREGKDIILEPLEACVCFIRLLGALWLGWLGLAEARRNWGNNISQ